MKYYIPITMASQTRTFYIQTEGEGLKATPFSAFCMAGVGA